MRGTPGGAMPSTAVILVAGRGSRLGPHTDDRPKCLVEVGGRAILERMLDELEAVGVRRVILVVGYQRERLRHRIGDRWGAMVVDYVVNPRWETTNNIVSLALACDSLDRDFLLLEGDLVLEPGRLAGVVPANAMAVARFRAPMNGTVVRLGEDDRVETFFLTTTPGRPDDLHGLHKTVNIYHFRVHDFMRVVRPRLEARMGAGDVNAYYEAALADAVSDGELTLQAVTFDDGTWEEVDDAEDLARAEHLAGGIPGLEPRTPHLSPASS
jgi:L-glutamine-phosphate cytidylyltransferase